MTRRQYSSPACMAHELPGERSMRPVRIKRIYEPRARGDGYRILVDRLWPRGVAKAKAGLHAWAREIAPSTELRQWFDHQSPRWSEFRKRYRRELATHEAEIEGIRNLARKRPVTLLYAARDLEHNHARVLQEVIEAV